MLGFMSTSLDTQRQLVSQEEQGKYAQAELDIFFQYWSRPEMAATITHDSYKVAFSCAVDATLDSNFAMARCFLRTGFCLRMWAKHGGAVMLSAMRAHDPDTAAGQAVEFLMRCMHQTKTDRGTVLYLAGEIPCNCLSAMSAKFEAEPSTRKCGACEVQKTSQQMMKCSGCHVVAYCSRECQLADWKAHKPVCNKACKH